MIICFPHKPGSGGPGSFQIRFEKEIVSRGWTITYRKDKVVPDIIFVVDGTKHLFWLLRMKLKGIPIIYRLDGINWLHRKKRVGINGFIRGEAGNFISKTIHGFLADKIIYQSHFVENWWNKTNYRRRSNYTIIYNGVKIPDLPHIKNKQPRYLLVLEGNIDYSPYAIKLLNELSYILKDDIEINLYGNFENKSNEKQLSELIKYHGFIKRDDVPGVMFGSIFLSLDINPACPNTVAEALSCGCPVVAYDTGSLKELVTSDSGIIVPYGSDPWSLEYPDIDGLVEAIRKLMNNFDFYASNARKRAINQFGVDLMTDKYINAIRDCIKEKSK